MQVCKANIQEDMKLGHSFLTAFLHSCGTLQTVCNESNYNSF